MKQIYNHIYDVYWDVCGEKDLGTTNLSTLILCLQHWVFFFFFNYFVVVGLFLFFFNSTNVWTLSTTTFALIFVS